MMDAAAIRAMSPGAELDLVVAKALGWKMGRTSSKPPYKIVECEVKDAQVFTQNGTSWRTISNMPSWSTNPEHAVRLLTEAERKGWHTTLVSGFKDGKDIIYTVSFGPWQPAHSPTFAESTSKAFLLAALEETP